MAGTILTSFLSILGLVCHNKFKYSPITVPFGSEEVMREGMNEGIYVILRKWDKLIRAT
jgi:hypothetical protein